MSVNSQSSGSMGAISRSHSENMGLVLEPAVLRKRLDEMPEGSKYTNNTYIEPQRL